MLKNVMIDTRLKNKIETAYSIGGCYSIRFIDLVDTFWFNEIHELQDFLNIQSKERYYDKKIRDGYFDYVNENNETLRYHVNSNRGKLTVIKEENLGVLN